MAENRKREFARLLERSGLDKEKLAAQTGYNVRTVYRWLSGETVPRKAVIDLLHRQTSLNLSGQYMPSSKSEFTFIDLFAGIGGLRMGFEAIGGQCVFTSEWDSACRKTYQANFSCDHPVEGDITAIHEGQIPAHDVLVAGFPCQPFSIAGV